MTLSALVIAVIAVPVAVALLLAAMVAFGTAAPPKAMESIGAPFKQMDYRDLPATECCPLRDGTDLVYRSYLAAGDRVAVLIHGSAGSGSSMHALAKGLQASGISAYAPDMRGHGATGQRGDIAYVGQLEDDLADFIAFIRSRHSQAQVALIGFSSGGGYVLRVAGGTLGGSFDHYVLISPYLGHKAPTQRPNSGGWVAPFIPRIIALVTLERMGIHRFEGLPVVAFAIQPGMEKILTTSYSYRLSRNFHPDADYLGDFRRTPKPMTVVIGADDETFYADRFAALIHTVRPDIAVSVVPGLGHVDMTVLPQGVASVVEALSPRSNASLEVGQALNLIEAGLT
ncbi:alpha/beta hydrolase [Telmatospirillum siberiense]|uniref:Alpha/beta hydrolase n=1 Tax=Telmatospirillum siberiense TaxID=382514 RepID=A0A2N3PTB3_9PROT|nr:alpha/beta hydrolase [Telmatospirillum siberiense]PKU23641.1 alpha/beta hydrolase [Telmatospirillum siberiense]